MSQELYYQAPSQAMFDEIKKEAIKIWQTYDDTYGYASEKVDRIKDLTNVKDNYMYMVAMFDDTNKLKLMAALKPSTVSRIAKALV